MIFNLLKSKSTLKDVIPDGFVDIHSHIIPGVDDGPENIEESIFLITRMKELGFSKIIGTPHTYPGLYDNTNKTIIEGFKLIHNECKINIKLEYSSEYMFGNYLSEKIIKLINSDKKKIYIN